MIDIGEVEQATRDASPPSSELTEEPQGSPISTVNVQTPVAPQRTGEHTNIQKTYRLTSTAHSTVQDLSMILSKQIGFDINNSVIIRSILRVIHTAGPEIRKATEEQLSTRQQPATAIGNEHIRDQLESDIADAIFSGILRYLANDQRSIPTQQG